MPGITGYSQIYTNSSILGINVLKWILVCEK